MTTIVYIHGAFASPMSFQRIREQLPPHIAVMPEYDVSMPISQIIDKVTHIIDEIGSDVHLVAHSLGGITAMHLAQNHPRVKSVFTMSSPFGGSKLADSLRWISGHELYRSLDSHNPILTKIRSTQIKVPNRCIITTVGNNPLMYEANDGVVSLKSQRALKQANQQEVQLNHFEVLMSNVIVNMIKDFVFTKDLDE